MVLHPLSNQTYGLIHQKIFTSKKKNVVYYIYPTTLSNDRCISWLMFMQMSKWTHPNLKLTINNLQFTIHECATVSGMLSLQLLSSMRLLFADLSLFLLRACVRHAHMSIITFHSTIGQCAGLTNTCFHFFVQSSDHFV